jgi:hypothetical protein
MSKDAYLGVNGKARRVTGIYVGAGGVARKVKSAYIGDADGKARLFYGIPYTPGIITPDNMTSDTAPAPYRTNAKNVWSSGYKSYLCFNNGINYCCSADGSVSGYVPSGGEWWVGIDLGEARYANRGRMKTSYNDNNFRVFPGDFQVLGSNDDSVFGENPTSDKWAVLGDITGYKPDSGNAWSSAFALDNPGYYRYYRFKITRGARNNENYITIGQIELSAV